MSSAAPRARHADAQRTADGDVMPPVPPAFLARMAPLLVDGTAALAAALDDPPLRGLRLNPLKGTPEALLERLPWRLSAVPWCEHGYFLDASGSAGTASRPGSSPLHAAGAYYLQDPSAMAPAAALAAMPGERVCDLAAAPGGKTTQLAGMMAGHGVLVANEVERRRAGALLANVERWGASNVVITQDEPERLARRLEGWFDRVLLDAPCSGEGMFRKSAEARSQWSEALVGHCSAMQSRLLDAAARLLRPGGLLAYSTCTFEIDENEAAVAAFLERHDDFAATDPGLPGLAPGLQADAPNGAAAAAASARLWPHRQRGDGQFVALLRKAGAAASDGSRPEHRASPRRPAAAPGGDYAQARPAPPSASAAWYAFAEATLGEVPFSGGRLLLHGDRLMAAPAELPPATGVHLLRVGVLLGHVRGAVAGTRFEPAHALALAAPAGGTMLSFEANDSRLVAYLAGEPFETRGPNGWLRVAVGGLPLGWARRTDHVVRSLYPRGLRRSAAER